MNGLFESGTPDKLAEDIYIHTLTPAIFAAIQRSIHGWQHGPKRGGASYQQLTAPFAAPPSLARQGFTELEHAETKGRVHFTANTALNRAETLPRQRNQVHMVRRIAHENAAKHTVSSVPKHAAHVATETPIVGQETIAKAAPICTMANQKAVYANHIDSLTVKPETSLIFGLF